MRSLHLHTLYACNMYDFTMYIIDYIIIDIHYGLLYICCEFLFTLFVKCYGCESLRYLII